MDFQIDTADAQRRILRVAEFADMMRGPIREALRTTANEIRDDAKASMPPRGRPSVRDETPTKQTGRLVEALMTKQPNSRRKDERAYVTTPAGDEWRYPWMLESGFPRIDGPRPFLNPAAQRHVTDFVSRVEAAVAQAVRETNR